MHSPTLTFDGTRKRDLEAGRGRIVLAMGLFLLCYAALAVRLVFLAALPAADPSPAVGAQHALNAARPDILDRNGEILATDIKTPSLYADPRRILDVEDAVDKLRSVLPDLDPAQLRRDLSSERAFVFVRRELTPALQAEIHAFGLPGLGFVEENRRVYPAGTTAAHILGHVNVDHAGLAGIERHLDDQGLAALHAAGISSDEALRPVSLSVDLRVQHALRAELLAAMETYRAKAAAGVILNAKSGEIVALVSLPDFDPNNGVEALQPDRLNRITGGVFELGSTVKAFTIAMALDEGTATLRDSYDARSPIRIGSFTIDDYRAQRRILTVPEIFVHSSNIGSARMALEVGGERHRAFLRRIGLLDRPRAELPERASPLVPAQWGDITTITAAFGHGVSIAPLQAASAGAALVNGGLLVPPTLLPRSEADARRLASPVLKPATSEAMRYLFRLNVEKGTATRAEAEGYVVGGKTGTAEKVENGRYVRNRLLTSFLGAFPMDDPEYVTLVMLDEPQGTSETHGYATAGWNAAPVTGRIVARVAPMLGVVPRLAGPRREEAGTPVSAAR